MLPCGALLEVDYVRIGDFVEACRLFFEERIIRGVSVLQSIFVCLQSVELPL